MKKYKIVFVLENYIPHIGGVEILFMHLAENLAKHHEVHIITHRLKNTKKEEVINNVIVHRVTVPSISSRYFFTLLSIPKIMKITKDADIIHTTTYNGAPPAFLVSRLYNKPSIITIHEVIASNWSSLLEMSWISGKIHQLLEWLVISLPFNAYICVSNSTKKDFETAKPNKEGITIYNGVEYEFWNRNKYQNNTVEIQEIKNKYMLKNSYSLLFFGRPGPTKGFTDLINAMAIIKKQVEKQKNQPIKLLAILSKDPAYQERYLQAKQVIKDKKLEDVITIIDPVPRKVLPLYLLAVDSIVVPSLTEGFGFSVAESCALDKVVIATNTKSIPEVISGKYVLVEPKNPKSLAQGMLRAYQRKIIQTPLKKFTWKTAVNNYTKIYERLMLQKNKKQKK